MNKFYTYDELYGILVDKNEQDTERVYFIVECLRYKFYLWMFSHGWNKTRDKPCERNGLRGYEVTINRNI